jgi:Phosphotransferase enzyme family
VEASQQSAQQDGSSEGITQTERAVFGQMTSHDVRSFLDSYVQRQLGSPISGVRFRAGRIDSVWGIDLDDGRAVVIKTHRLPVDLEAVRTTRDALKVLSDAGYPCPTPLSGPDEIDGRVVTAETLLTGEMPDGRDPGNRRLLADGLARHIALLREWPDLAHRTGPGPSWCQYQEGPWPVPHDTIVDFSSSHPGYEWVDEYGQRASAQVLHHRDTHEVVVGHADWYAGNTVIDQGVLAGTFDWELVADTEAVIAGFAAACYAASPTGGGGLSTPEEVVAFMGDYDQVRGEPLTRSEQRAAAGAAAWIGAFNARWQVALIQHDLADYDTINLVRERHDDFLSLSW